MLKGRYLGWTIDFTSPKGEMSLQHPSSLQWRVFKNPIALGVGGIAAVLMEFADARIRSGVWDHSTYKIDPIGRSKRTGIAAMVGVYGPESAARRVIAGVTNMHAKVQGQTPKGEHYRALDTELLDWVAATASYGFLNAYDRFVRPLSATEQTRFYSESWTVTQLYGVKTSPSSPAAFEAMMMALADRFEPHPIVMEFLDIIQSGKAAPFVPKFLHRAVARASVSILPPLIRERLQLGKAFDLTRTDRIALKAAAGLAERLPLAGTPASQASVRLGLPWNYPYMGEAARLRALEKAGLTRPTPMLAAAAE
ncbi:MAG TPA: histidine kinase [Alphaproteobacteria bacterium]|nr:histidine kinase [Alphaproteobacteria bacterium]HAJ47800.1 histidine kinase [Alphaproteobacteria bacterium]